MTSEPRTLRAWMITLLVSAEDRTRTAAYDIWAHDEVEAARLALADAAARHEKVLDAVRAERGPIVPLPDALPQVRFRASHTARLRAA
jgi:hypothetical protein